MRHPDILTTEERQRLLDDLNERRREAARLFHEKRRAIQEEWDESLRREMEAYRRFKPDALVNRVTPGRASVYLATPKEDVQEYTLDLIAQGVSYEDGRGIILQLLGDMPYETDVYMGEYYSFKGGYFLLKDPHPEVQNGDYATPAPPLWIKPGTITLF